MGFVGVYRALYDYAPTGDGELEIKEGDLLYIQEKSATDDWWKAKKKAVSDDVEEPEGLIPNNYVEEAQASGKAKALYDYSRQTDEEISFAEDAILSVYDTSDEDWTLVGLDGDYGFAPANYIEPIGDSAAEVPPPMPARPRAESTAQAMSPARSASPAEPSPAAAIAGLIQQKTGQSIPGMPPRPPQQFTPEDSEEEEAPPPKPARPQSQAAPTPIAPSAPRSPSPPQTHGIMASDDRGPMSPGGYHLYNIHEMISHMGRNRKMPITFGINVAKGTVMVAPEKSRDTQEWTAEKLTHYSMEGKHVFIELVRPSKSIDFHAGAKDTAAEIVQQLGELAGAARGGGLREVIAASNGVGQKKGRMLYEFMAQGDDEVTVAVDDEVLVLDDSQSDEWWMVRRLKNGKEGVVPSSYVEITETLPPVPAPGHDSAKSYVEQNRLEEQRLAREGARSSSSSSKQKSKSSSDSKTLPNNAKVRTWTDRSANFKVDAEFLGLKDSKIHLHKQNGVKIAVPVSKMSIEDIEYVERATGISLDEEKPLSDIKRRSTLKSSERTSSRRAGASVEPEGPRYDWFNFFLQCGVNPQVCERYANAFSRDNMGEENLQDIDATLLRTLGIKEGDILRIMKFLDSRFSRAKKESDSGDQQGLFSGAGGILRNNTRKSRPAPAVESNDTVNADAFKAKPDQSASSSAGTSPLPGAASKPSGFDDNAWDNRPAKTQPEQRAASQPSQPAAAPIQAVPTGAMADLSILSAPLPTPLQPSPAPAPQQTLPAAQAPAPSSQPSQPQGADSAFFDQLAKPGAVPQQISQPRTRPLAPQQTGQGSLIAPPPPNRPTSAPQTQQQSQFAPPPLAPQRTGGYVPQQLPQLAPPGQSMGELQHQQQYAQQFQLQHQQTGYYGQPGYGQLQPQPTGFAPGQFGAQAPQQMNPSPFADPPRMPYQPTGFQQPQPTGYGQPTFQQMQPTGPNHFLPPALQPQPTGMQQQPMQPQPTGFGSMNGQFGQPAPQMPPLPQQNQYSLQPLQAQKTGPAPPVRFGVQDAPKLVPQPTGRANLSKASVFPRETKKKRLVYAPMLILDPPAAPQNPFGF